MWMCLGSSKTSTHTILSPSLLSGSLEKALPSFSRLGTHSPTHTLQHSCDPTILFALPLPLPSFFSAPPTQVHSQHPFTPLCLLLSSSLPPSPPPNYPHATAWRRCCGSAAAFCRCAESRRWWSMTRRRRTPCLRGRCLFGERGEQGSVGSGLASSLLA